MDGDAVEPNDAAVGSMNAIAVGSKDTAVGSADEGVLLNDL